MYTATASLSTVCAVTANACPICVFPEPNSPKHSTIAPDSKPPPNKEFKALLPVFILITFSLLFNNSIKEVHALMQQLHAPRNINKTIIRIHGIEREADYIYHLAMADLFATKQRDTRELIILKDLYEALETIIDNTESVARVVENMIAKDRV